MKSPRKLSPRFIKYSIGIALVTAMFAFIAILLQKDRVADGLGHGYRLVHRTEKQLWNGSYQTVRLAELYHDAQRLGLVGTEREKEVVSISPTGRFALFAAAAGGCGRLFLFDRDSKQLRPILPDGPSPSKFSWQENAGTVEVAYYSLTSRKVDLRN